MKVECRRNCYNHGVFGHLAKNCRNKGMVERGRRLEYGNEDNGQNCNLKGEESLTVLD